jgi:hypothetical protein
MKIIQALFRSCIISSAFLAVNSIAVAQEMKSAVPRVFSIDGPTLAETKRRIQSSDKSFAAALTKLETDARRALQQKPLSVVAFCP